MLRSRLLAALAAALLVACGTDDDSPSVRSTTPAPIEPAPSAIDLGVAPLAAAADGAPRLLQAIAAIPAPAGATPEVAARHHLAQLAPLWLRGDAAHLELIAVHPTRGGGAIVRLRQRAHGLEIEGGELRVLLRGDGSLVAVRGGLVAPSATGADFALAPGAALAAALDDDTGIALAARDVAVAKRAGGYQALLAPPRSDLAMEKARAKAVLAADAGRLVPAYVVEYLATTAGERTGKRYVVAADDGRVLHRADLVAEEPFLYRVWADPDGRPLDGPIADWSPHPTGSSDGRIVPYAPSAQVVMDGFNGPRDPWLAAGAAETTGNNVEVFTDRNGDDRSDGADFHGAPSGPGVFDHTYRTDAEPMASAAQTRAAMTHLFYVNNWLHDWWYDRGFTEVAGNAQASNLGRGGLENDHLIAQAQDGAISYPANDPSGSGPRRNNANMLTPDDGMSPVMQMYLFTDKVEVIQATPGGPVPALARGTTSFDVSGRLVAVTDSSGALIDGCAATQRLFGAIALVKESVLCNDAIAIDELRALGAGGVIIASATEPYIAHPPSDRGPALGTTRAGGERLRAAAAAGPVQVRLLRDVGVELDSALDTTIVAHEWGHYLHHRLTDCYSTEQCGALSEGWGDFVALHLMVRAGDNLDGAYAQGVYSRGRRDGTGAYLGIRRYPYSTDRRKNALSFRHIANGATLPDTVGDPWGDNAEVHNAGEVWATMLWEAYRALIARHGVDEARLRMGDYVVAGLLMTPVDATFTESRDALLTAAGEADAADRDVMARAFASRGAGSCAVSPPPSSLTFTEVVESDAVSGRLVAAAQGLVDDGASCDRDGFLDPGETGTLTVVVANAGPVTTGAVTITATPNLAGVTIAPVTVPALAPYTRVTVALPVVAATTLATDSQLAIAFTVRADGTCAPATGAVAVFTGVDEEPAASRRDDVEARTSAWRVTGDPLWTRAVESAGNHLLRGAAATRRADAQLVSPPLVVGSDDALVLSLRHRFWFDSYPGGEDGGVVELSRDDGATWHDVADLGAAMPYDGRITSRSNPLQNRRAFSTKSAGWPAFAALTVDLSGAGLAGETVRVRFRVGSSAWVAGNGWEIDDITLAGVDSTPFPRRVAESGSCAGGVGVDAGAPRTVDAGATVTLTGVVGGLDAATVGWSQDAGPAVALAGADTLTVSFVAPAAGSDVVLRLTARDGAREASDTVAIHVDAPPIAFAGADRSVDSGAAVVLAATAVDDDGDALTLGWTQVGGPAVALAGATTLTPSFTAPVVRRDAVVELELTVSDGRTSVSDRIAIAVRRVHTPPEVGAGVDRTVDSGAIVALGGVAGDDDDDPLTTSWSQLEGPAVTLSDVHALTARFTAPVVRVDTRIVLRLTVSDGDATVSDDVVITVRRTRTRPTVDAGPDQAVGDGDTVVLAGVATDAEGDPVTVSWTRVSGPAISLTGSTTLTPHFVAPEVIVDTAIVLRLTASDADGRSDDTVTILVRRTHTPPEVSAGVDQTVDSGAAVTLVGAASDVENDPVTVTWSQESGPAVTLDSVNGLRPRFTAPTVARDAVIVLRLTGRDGDGEGTDTVSITVRRTRRSPVVSAGGDQTVDAGARVTLAGTATDPEGDPFTVTWTQTEGPPVTLSDARALAPTFAAPVSPREVRLGFRLVVRETGGADVVATVTITVRARPPFVVDAGPARTVASGETVALTGTVTGLGSEQATVLWQQTRGPTGALANPTTLTPRFTAPTVSRDDVVVLTLTVSGPGADPVRASVTITVGRTHRPPVASAGADRTVDSGASVELAGSAQDPESDPVTVAWTQVGGPAVVLERAGTFWPHFVAPRVLVDTALTFELTVSDGAAATDQVVVTVRAQRPPTLDAGGDQVVDSGTWVALGASASDAEGDAITATWSQVDGPAVGLVDAHALWTGFHAPRVARDTDVVLRLTVEAGGDVVSDDIVIRVRRTVDAPEVDAGADLVIDSGATVTLAGAATDPEDDPLTISWVQVSGPALLIAGADTLAPRVTAPRLERDGEAVLRLIVFDGSAEVGDLVRITVRGNQPPEIDAGADQDSAPGATVTLRGTARDADALTVRWHQISGAPVRLVAAVATSTSFTVPADAAGAALVFELHADDGLAMASDRVTVRVRAAAPSPEPEPGDGGGCRVAGGAGSSGLLTLAVAALLARRRRRGSRRVRTARAAAHAGADDCQLRRWQRRRRRGLSRTPPMNELDHRADGNTIDAMADALTAAAASFATLSRAGKPLRLRFAAPESPSGSFALAVTVVRDHDGYHLRAEPEACLEAGAEQRERLAVLDGMVIEARGRDAETAVDLLLAHVEHYLRPLVAWVVAGG